MEHAHKEKREIARDTRLRRHELRELGVRKSYENWRTEKKAFIEKIYKSGHVRFEEAFELNNLDLLLIIGCCHSLCFDI